MSIDVLVLLLFNSLLIIGLHRASVYYTGEDGSILEDTKGSLWRVRRYCLGRFGDFWSKPLITCPPCMASLHSTYVFWMWAYFSGVSVYVAILYFMYIPALSGLTYIVNNKID